MIASRGPDHRRADRSSRFPPILVPLPIATDDHQTAIAASGAGGVRADDPAARISRR
jgi:hypothetical protein